jgi:hypothetical protein
VRPVYDASGNFRGSWSAAGVFERSGFTPQNLRTSVAFATPTFSWDMVEGAEAYELQVDDDPNFGSTAVSVTTSRNSYTPTGTLAQGVYYWRVRARRYSNIFNGWTASQTFTLALPEPTGLTHSPAPIPPRAPTLCWTPLVASADDQPVFTAWKYRVQVSREPTFSSVYDTVDTEQACWTPTKGYDDGGYYWRVAAIDGEGKLGRYGAAAEFTKQYPMPTLLSPAHGSAVSDTPTFAWTPVTGAASYKLEVSLNPTFSPVYDSATTNNARVTPAKRYEAEQIYYWRVAMVDKDKKAGPFVGEQVAVVEEVKRYLPWVAGSW